MKNFFKVLTLGLVLAVFAAANVTTTFAQQDEQAVKEAIYNKYMENYKGDIQQRKVAVEAAKEYIQKYKDSPADEEQIKYFTDAIPQLEKGIKDTEAAAATAAAAEATAKQRKERYVAFDTALKAENWDNVYSSGKQILAEEPDFLDVILVLGSVGLDESLKDPANKKFNNDTVTYAKLAIDKINSGKTTDNFGALKYTYKTKENALGWMNWTIGNLLYFHMNNEKDALQYLYEASKHDSEVKDFPEIYRAMGRWYLNKVVEMEKVRNEKLTAADNVDTPETLALLAQNKGYADRAIDAYSRAYNFAKANPKTTKEYKDSVFSKLQELYKFRYDEDAMKTDAKINADVATVMRKPMPSPNTTVAPIETSQPAVDANTTTDAAATDGAERNRTVEGNTNKAAKPDTTKANTNTTNTTTPKTNTKPKQTTPKKPRQR